jgi:hypothetical protein
MWLFVLVNILVLLQNVKSDQPVHCIRGQVYGTWNFYVSQNTEQVNLFETQQVCTHMIPNK